MLVLLITAMLDWSCTFTIISICLAILYTVLLLVCLFYSFRLLRLPCHKRQSQRCFLYLVISQCVLRAVYFFLWPILIANTASASASHDRCGFTIEGEHEGLLLLVIGSLPSALFLSAFTINVFTFSRIYHMTLNHSVTKYRLVLALMLAVNLVTYSSLLFLYIVTFASSSSSLSASSPPPSSAPTRLSDVAESVYVYALSCSFCVIAASFSFYGIKLWLGVRQSASGSASTLRASASFSSTDGMTAPYAPRAHLPSFHGNSASHHPHHAHGLLSAPFLTPSDSHLSSFSTASSSQAAGGSSCLPSYHPMLKLSVVSTLCMLCFLVRVILVPLLSHYAEGQISFPLLLLYHSLSEALPLLLVLYLFDPVREGKGQLLSPAASPAMLGTGDEQDFQITDDDLYPSPRDALPGTAAALDSASPASSSAASTPVPTQFSYLGDSLAGSLGSIGSVRGAAVGGAGGGGAGEAVSPRELERRRARSGMSYESAFKQDLKSLLADD